MTRREHVEWAKQRALDELEKNGPEAAVTSMTSDLWKHDEMRNDTTRMLISAATMILTRPASDESVRREIKHWVEGFN